MVANTYSDSASADIKQEALPIKQVACLTTSESGVRSFFGHDMNTCTESFESEFSYVIYWFWCQKAKVVYCMHPFIM